MNDREKVVLILALAVVAIVSLIVAFAIADNATVSRSAIGVATACVAVLATMVTRLSASNGKES